MTPPTRGPVQAVDDGFLGRRRELEMVATWLDAARRGGGRLVLCVGEPGIGKTRLAQELAGVALAGGTTVSWGRCVEAEGAPAFWPWRQVLRSLGVEPDTVLTGDVESPKDRFRVFDDVAHTVRGAFVRPVNASSDGSAEVIVGFWNPVLNTVSVTDFHFIAVQL